MYNETVLDHFYNPRNAGKIENANSYIDKLIKEVNSDQEGETSYFNVSFSEPVVVEVPKSYTLNAVVAGLLGLIISLGIILYRR